MRNGLAGSFSLILLGACGHGPSDFGPDCARTLETVTADDETLGFSANEALAFLEANRPFQVLWSETTQTGGSAAMGIEIQGINGDVQRSTVEKYVDACEESGQTLVIPVNFRVTIAGGEVIAEGTTPLEFGALDVGRIYSNTDRELPLEMGGSYQEALDLFFEENYASQGFEMDGVYLSLFSAWEEGATAIFLTASGPQGNLTSVAWRGRWVLSTP